MLIIGENINATRKKVAEAIKQRNGQYITDLAVKQVQSGVDFIDVNAGSGYSDSLQKQAAIQWMVETVQAQVDVPLVIDSDEPEVIGAALEKYQGERVLINSVTDEKESLEAIGRLAAGCGAWLVGLAMGDSGIPETSEQRLEHCKSILKCLADHGIKPEQVFFDPLVIPVSVQQEQASVTLETITSIKKSIPGARTVMGLSNISFGLPGRKLINRTFLAMAAAAGLDAAILDPLDSNIMSMAKAADVLTGRDKWCRRYSRAHRQGRLEK